MVMGKILMGMGKYLWGWGGNEENSMGMGWGWGYFLPCHSLDYRLTWVNPQRECVYFSVLNKIVNILHYKTV